MTVQQAIPGVTVKAAELLGLREHFKGSRLRRLLSFSENHHSSLSGLRGRGMDYQESRAYLPGDDSRTLDWRVMARTGEAHTKVFAEEKERTVLLGVDMSPSLFFGTRYAFKSWAAAQVAASFAWIAVEAGHQLAGLICAEEGEYQAKARAKTARATLMSLFSGLEQAAALDLLVEGHPDSAELNRLLLTIRGMKQSGCLLVIISDFLGLNEQSPALFKALARQHDLMLVWVYDETETDLWPAGDYQIRQSQQTHTLNLQAPNVQSWLSDLQAHHHHKIEQLSRQLHCPLLPISCNEPVVPQVQRFLGG